MMRQSVAVIGKVNTLGGGGVKLLFTKNKCSFGTTLGVSTSKVIPIQGLAKSPLVQALEESSPGQVLAKSKFME